jgi:hypothetical protein
VVGVPAAKGYNKPFVMLINHYCGPNHDFFKQPAYVSLNSYASHAS